MSDLSYRNIWISLAIVMPIGAIGLIVLRGDQQAKGLLVLAAVFFAVFLRHALDRRELRRNEED